MIKLFRKCFLCGDNRDTKFITDCWTTGCSTTYYHDACLEKILDNPVDYCNYVVNKANNIMVSIQHDETYRYDILEEARSNSDAIKKIKRIIRRAK